MKKTKEKIIEDWKRDLIFDLGNLVSPEAIIIIFGKIDELLSLQTQEMVEEIVGKTFFRLQEEKNKLIKPMTKKEGEEKIQQNVGEIAMIRAVEVVQHFLLTEYNVDLAEYIHKNHIKQILTK